MAYKRSGYPAKALTPDTFRTYAIMVGAGAASPTIPTAAQAATVQPGAANSNANLSASRSGVAGVVVTTRTAAGDHTYTFATDASPAVLHALQPVAWGTSALKAKLYSAVITAGALIVRVQTSIADGTLTDMADGVDFLTFIIDGGNVTV